MLLSTIHILTGIEYKLFGINIYNLNVKWVNIIIFRQYKGILKERKIKFSIMCNLI